MIDRLQSAQKLCPVAAGLLLFSRGAFRGNALYPPFYRDVHIPQPERPPPCGRRSLRRVRSGSGQRRGCVCAGTVSAGVRTADVQYKKAPKASGFGRFFVRGEGEGRKKAPSGAGERLTAWENFDIMKRLYWEDGHKHIPTLI